MTAQEKRDLLYFSLWAISVFILFICLFWWCMPKLALPLFGFFVFFVATGKAVVSFLDAIVRHNPQRVFDLPFGKFWLDMASVGLAYSAVIGIAIASSKVDVADVFEMSLSNIRLTGEELVQRKKVTADVKDLSLKMDRYRSRIDKLEISLACFRARTAQKCPDQK